MSTAKLRSSVTLARAMRPVIEVMERRVLLSQVFIEGSIGDDAIQIYIDGGNVKYSLNGNVTTVGSASALWGFSVEAKEGDDTVTNNTGFVMNASGDQGHDVLQGGTGEDALHGGDGDDLIYGGDDDDVGYGNAGNDTVYGDGGHDLLYGEDDNDLVYGGYGNDTIEHSCNYTGNDTYYGDDGNDVIGSSVLSGIPGVDGADMMYGGAGDDVFYSRDAYGDQVYGGIGDDTVYADFSDGVTDCETIARE